MTGIGLLLLAVAFALAESAEADRPAPASFAVYPNRSRAFLRLAITLVFLAGSVWAFFAAPDPDAGFNDRVARFVAGYAGPPFALFFSVVALRQLLTSTPLLEVNDRGITVHHHGVGLIRWVEIAEVRAHGAGRGRVLQIIPRDLEALLARLSPSAATNTRWRTEQFGAPVVLSENLLPVPADRVAEQIHEFCRKTFATRP